MSWCGCPFPFQPCVQDGSRAPESSHVVLSDLLKWAGEEMCATTSLINMNEISSVVGFFSDAYLILRLQKGSNMNSVTPFPSILFLLQMASFPWLKLTSCPLQGAWEKCILILHSWQIRNHTHENKYPLIMAMKC